MVSLMILAKLPVSAQCNLGIEEESSGWTTNIFGDIHAACTKITYCISIVNFGESTIDDITLTFTNITKAFNHLLNPVELNGFTEIADGTYTLTVSVPAESTATFCLSFQADASFQPGIDRLIDADMTVSASNCSDQTFVYDGISPAHVKYFVNDTPELLSELISQGLMLTLQEVELGSPQKIVINGQLIVDTDYLFSLGGRLLMGPNASVIIQGNGTTLRMRDQASVIACTDMWDRIEVKEGATLDLEGVDPSVNQFGLAISDGLYGIQLNDGATLRIKNTTFLNNDRSITTPEAFVPRHFVIEIEGENNYITSDGNMKPPRAGQLPYAGMRLHELNGVTIMGSPGNTIEFSHLERGIVLWRSNATIGKLRFRDIHGSLPHAPSLGTAIFAGGLSGSRKLTYIGFDDAGIDDISNCETGIRANLKNLDLSGIRMAGVNKGIEVLKSKERHISIKENIINARQTGVGLFQNMPTNLNLADNIVNIHDDLDGWGAGNGIGIRGEENATAPALFIYQIRNNLVNVDNARTGIRFQSGTAFGLRNNTVALLDEDRETYFGMDIQGSLWPFALCNLVLGNGSASDWKSAVGINAYGSSLSRFLCNEVQDTDVGFRFLGMGDDTELRGSSINEHRLGVLVETGGHIGDQTHFGNEWLGTDVYGGQGNNYQPVNGKYGAFNGNDNPSFSHFFVDQVENPLFNTSVNQSNWFFIDNNAQSSFYCETWSFNYCPGGAGSSIKELAEETPPSIDVLDYEIARDSIPHATCPEAVNWTAQRHLYRRLMMEPSLYASDTLMQDFVTWASQGTVGDFQEIEDGIIALFTLDSLTDAGVEALETDLEQERMAIFSLNMALRDSLPAEAADSLKQLRAARLATLAQATATSDSLWAAIYAERDSLAQLLVTKNAAVNATEQHEINEQLVNDIFLKTLTINVDTFTAQQVNDLRDLSMQCPDCGGDAVFRARSLFALHDPYAVFDDRTLCGGAEERSAMPGDAPPVSGFQVYPNPAGHELTVVLTDAKDNTERELVLHNILGKEMLRLRLPGNETRFVLATARFPSGVYFLSVLESNGKVFSQQVTIIK